MSVYLGEQGTVQIRRTGEPVGFVLEPADVDVNAKRMSVEFGGPCPFITGDQVEVKLTGAGDLELLADVTGENDVTRWIHVDQAGGIRFYTSYASAVSGSKTDALALVEPSRDQDVTMDVVNLRYNCVAQMRAWEITTQRETVDTTLLGQEFRSSYDQGLISGQGSITAIWDYEYTACNDLEYIEDAELAQYFSQLVIRFKEGSKFKGLFYIYYGKNESVWYDCDCIVTSVGMNFSPGAVIDSQIQFVTTGVIELKQGSLPPYLTQESDPPRNLLDLEEGLGSLELETDLD
jgi:hypothetical protein